MVFRTTVGPKQPWTVEAKRVYGTPALIEALVHALTSMRPLDHMAVAYHMGGGGGGRWGRPGGCSKLGRW